MVNISCNENYKEMDRIKEDTTPLSSFRVMHHRDHYATFVIRDEERESGELDENYADIINEALELREQHIANATNVRKFDAEYLEEIKRWANPIGNGFIEFVLKGNKFHIILKASSIISIRTRFTYEDSPANGDSGEWSHCDITTSDGRKYEVLASVEQIMQAITILKEDNDY